MVDSLLVSRGVFYSEQRTHREEITSVGLRGSEPELVQIDRDLSRPPPCPISGGLQTMAKTQNRSQQNTSNIENE